MTTEELREILEAHKLWVDSGGKSGARADLSGANLIGADLSEADLREADLNRTDLSGAKFSPGWKIVREEVES